MPNLRNPHYMVRFDLGERPAATRYQQIPPTAERLVEAHSSAARRPVIGDTTSPNATTVATSSFAVWLCQLDLAPTPYVGIAVPIASVAVGNGREDRDRFTP
jgi:hypothetical protein